MTQFGRLLHRSLVTGCVAALASMIGPTIPSGLSAPPATTSAEVRPFGIPKRTPWTRSRLQGSLEPPAPYKVERVFERLSFNNPVDMANAPGSDRLFVAELDGKIYSFPNQPDVQQADLFVDLTQGTQPIRRLYGITFDPHFEANRICYLCYVLDGKVPDGSRVSRYRVVGEPPRIDPASEEILITWVSGGHNGGCLKFGPDGYLYISTGDGGDSFPPDGRNTGQDISDLTGSILRIDVHQPEPGRLYRIPRDNPFVDLAGARGEIWAYGLRNPWKICFDTNGDLWTGDVGWEMWELVFKVERGGNYGWSIKEGVQPVHLERTRGPTPILPPTYAHPHVEARSITGGYVYRGSRLPELAGAYIYGDYVTGKFWSLRHDGQDTTTVRELVDSDIAVVTFGVDNAGELYFMGHSEAAGIYRLVANPAKGPNRDFPRLLSQTGLFESVEEQRPAPGVIPYSINAEPWADGASATRLVAVPGEATLGVYETENVQVGMIKGAWSYPDGAVLAKTLSLEMTVGDPASRRNLETQILHRDGDTWRGYTYIWNDEQTDAALAEAEGLDRTLTLRDRAAPGGIRRQTWHYASRTECIVCHTTRAGSIQGFIPPQLNRNHDYGGVVDNQLRALAHIGLFAEPPSSQTAPYPDPQDPAVDLDRRARAYLHVNCAHCHRRGGGGSAAIDVRFEQPLAKTNLLDDRPTQGTFNIHGAAVIAAGDPYRSVLWYRLAKLGRGRMPYAGSSVVDQRGIDLIHDWIAAMPAKLTVADSGDSNDPRRVRERAALLVLNGQSPQPVESRKTIEQLLSTTSGALMAVRAIDDSRLSAAAQAQLVAVASGHEDAQIRDLFERYLPEEHRTRRLGAIVKPAEILALKGDSARGAALFAKAEGVQCRNCHKIGATGRSVGPDLDQIGKKLNRALLLESLLEPSKSVDARYVAYVVETRDGLVHTGLLVSKDDRQVVLKDPQGKELTIPAAQIELFAPQQKSLMPDLQLRDLTAEQVADLLSYLESLKG